MKTQIKNCIIIVLINMSCSSILPTHASEELISQLQEELLILTQTQDELISISKEARPLAKRIKYLAKRLNLLVLFTLPEKCEKSTEKTILSMEKNIAKLETKQCQMQLTKSTSVTKSSNLSHRCIPDDILNTYLPTIKNSFQNIKSTFLTDDDANKIPDVCEN